MDAVQVHLQQFDHVLPHKELNTVQSTVAPYLLFTNGNAVIASPTGSGKTLLLELALLQVFHDRLLLPTASSSQSHFTTKSKAVYCCPLRSLAREKYESWCITFGKHLNVALETEDSVDAGYESVLAADIIVTTPERWDSITRRWKDGAALAMVLSVSLLLIDEVHTLNDDRGSVLEALVSRMKSISSFTGVPNSATRSPIRLIAVSGTIPNVGDVAEWLSAPAEGTFVFGDEVRPVPLTVLVRSFPMVSQCTFAIDKFLNTKLFSIVCEFSAGKPALVFCSTRKEATKAAVQLKNEVEQESTQRGCALPVVTELEGAAPQFHDRTLALLVRFGIAYHHAAMSPEDRRLVERLFCAQLLSVLCATSTLAVGVNLPARLVVVKGTSVYRSGKESEYSLTEIAQMCGRAGRLGLDTVGVAVILTSSQRASRVESICDNNNVHTPVESQLHKNVVEHLNAEIALKTVQSREMGVEWLKTTYFWIRLCKSPRSYGLTFATKLDEEAFRADSFAEELVEQMIAKLEHGGCIQVESGAQGKLILATRLGRLMAKFYVEFESAVELHRAVELQKTERCTVREALKILCHSAEFRECRLRGGDKGHLNQFNKTLRYGVDTGMRGGREIREHWHKAFVLLQLTFSRVTIEDTSLRNDAAALLKLAPRLSRFLFELSLGSSASLIRSILTLTRCIDSRCWWDDGNSILRGWFPGPDDIAKRLALHGISSLSSLMKLSPNHIESICQQSPPFGLQLIELVSPLRVASIDAQLVPRAEGLCINCSLTISGLRTIAVNKFVVLLVSDRTHDQLLLYRRVRCGQAPWTATFSINVPNTTPSNVFAELLFEGSFGLDETLDISSGCQTDRISETRQSPAELPSCMAPVPPLGERLTILRPRATKQPRVECDDLRNIVRSFHSKLSNW